jgi:hypothetical protein
MAICVREPRCFGSKAFSLARLIVVCGLSVAVVALVSDKARSQDAQGRFTQRYVVPQKPKPAVPLDRLRSNRRPRWGRRWPRARRMPRSRTPSRFLALRTR